MDLPADATARASYDLGELELRIKSRIREFELSALLDLLASIGYDPGDIELRGHLGSSPQPGMVHDIEISGPPLRGVRPSPPLATRRPVAARVVLTVNLGLLSCRSPLPSYLLRMCQELETADPMLELLRALDRSLLHTRLTSDLPDRLLAGWDDVHRDFLRIHGLDSPLGLHWLFRSVFPELEAHVHRITDDYRVPFDPARLGTSSLGRCAFGNTSRITVFDVEVTLIAAEPTLGHVPWPLIAARRIRRLVLPLLDEVCMNLTVAFVLLDRSAHARLLPTSYLGYDPMAVVGEGGEPGGAPRLPEAGAMPLPPARVVLYRGALPYTEPSTDELEQAMAAGERLEREPRWMRRRSSSSPADGGAEVLSLVYTTSAGRRHAYDVEVRWGVRAWYGEEPFQVRVTHDGMPKADVDPRHHPNLWQWLRDEARGLLANRISDEVTALEPDDRVGLALIARLIDEGDPEALHALFLSRHTPQERWEDAAWQRFSEWRES